MNQIASDRKVLAALQVRNFSFKTQLRDGALNISEIGVAAGFLEGAQR